MALHTEETCIEWVEFPINSTQLILFRMNDQKRSRLKLWQNTISNLLKTNKIFSWLLYRMGWAGKWIGADVFFLQHRRICLEGKMSHFIVFTPSSWNTNKLKIWKNLVEKRTQWTTEKNSRNGLPRSKTTTHNRKTQFYAQ